MAPSISAFNRNLTESSTSAASCKQMWSVVLKRSCILTTEQDSLTEIICQHKTSSSKLTSSAADYNSTLTTPDHSGHHFPDSTAGKQAIISNLLIGKLHQTPSPLSSQNQVQLFKNSQSSLHTKITNGVMVWRLQDL